MVGFIEHLHNHFCSGRNKTACFINNFSSTSDFTQGWVLDFVSQSPSQSVTFRLYTMWMLWRTLCFLAFHYNPYIVLILNLSVPFYPSAYKLASHFLPFRVFSQIANAAAIIAITVKVKPNCVIIFILIFYLQSMPII